MKKNIICISFGLFLFGLWAKSTAVPIYKLSPDTSESGILNLKKRIALAAKDTGSIASVYEKLGTFYFTRNNDSCLMMFDSASFFYYKIKKLSNQAICFQNMAFGYDEIKKDSLRAIEYAESSLNVWLQLSDTLMSANMYKYLGYLYSKTREFNKAKHFVNEAMIKFNSKNYNAGVAVCHFDLAEAYKNQGILDSAICHADIAKQYWLTVSGQPRIFGINNFLLSIFLVKKDTASAKKYFEENRKLEYDTGIYWKVLLDFYSYSIRLNDELKNSSVSEEYTNKTKSKKRELIKNGIKAD